MFCFWHIFFWCKSTTPSASTVLAQDLIPNQALKIILKIWTHWGYKFILKKNYLDVQGWTQMNSRVNFKTGWNWVKSTGAQSFIGSLWVKIMIGCHINLHIISWRYELSCKSFTHIFHKNCWYFVFSSERISSVSYIGHLQTIKTAIFQIAHKSQN